MSASSRITFALFPPNSSVTRLTVGAAACETLTPAPVEPVNDLCLPLGANGSLSISLPCPETRLKTPAGRADFINDVCENKCVQWSLF